MASRNFYIQLIIRVLIIFALCIFSAIAFIKSWYLFFGVAALTVIFSTYFLIVFINRTNRKIAYFFDAIKNEDFTLRFPEKVNIKSFKELNQSLNRVNNLIQEVHLKLQERERYYQIILKEAEIGIMTYNKKGHILFSNPTLEKLFNYAPLNHIKQLNQIDEKLYLIFNGFKSFQRKLVKLTNEREEMQLALKTTPIVLNGEELLLVVVQDIHTELDEKQTDSWIRLIRVLTHEIMNTITPITSISESIGRYYRNEGEIISKNELTEEQLQSTVKGLEVIQNQGNNLMDFVLSYRSFLNVPKPDKTLINAKALFEKLQLLTAPNLPEGINVQWDHYEDDLAFFADEKQLIQVLLNLVKNGINALEGTKNGKLHIAAKLDSDGKKRIEVTDNGAGIPPELLDDIFVPFFTTKEKGTGIGLSLSKQIMQLHGGGLNVRSVPNKKTVFTVVFN